MNNIVERLLYISLAVLLISNLVALGLLIHLTLRRSVVGNEIKSAVTQIEAKQNDNTSYIVCIGQNLAMPLNERVACQQ